MNPTARVDLSRKLTLVAYGALLVSLVTSWKINNSDPIALDLLLIAVLPLLAFLPWLLKGSNRAHIGLCCVLLVYIIKAVLGVTLQLGLTAVFEAAASLTLFCSALYYVHTKHLLRKPQLNNPADSGQ